MKKTVYLTQIDDGSIKDKKMHWEVNATTNFIAMKIGEKISRSVINTLVENKDIDVEINKRTIVSAHGDEKIKKRF
mgnify:FL=1